ncbi:MAG: hypothetical protein RIB60_06340 [Phycisphaerales bacterium]
MPSAPGRTTIRTLIVVTVLAALAWALAESQTIQTEPLSLQLVLADGSEGQSAREEGPVVRVAPDEEWGGLVEVTIAGSAALTDALGDRLLGTVTLTVGADFPSEPGIHEIDLREAMRDSESFRGSGVTIESVAPARVRVEVGQLGVRELPVAVVVPEGVELDGTPTVTPGTVRFIAPRSVLDEYGPAAVVSAIVGERELGPLVPGRAETVRNVPVQLPPGTDLGWSIRLDPSRVDVGVTVRSKSATLTIPTLPVQVRMSPAEVGRWSINIEPADQDLIDVVLTGPQEQLDRIQRGEVRPSAVISLSFADLEAGIETARARVADLPAGVRAQIPNDAVRLRIARVSRDDPAVSGP